MADPFIEALTRTLSQEALVEPGQTVVIAVSGGPDSTALMHGLCQVNAREGWRLRLVVGHLHHGLRGLEADEDERFVRLLCQEIGLEFHVEHLDARALAAERKLSLETAARQARYAFFVRCASQFNADRVALGHHADDQAETVLQRIVRGTGLRGLAGMPLRRRLEGVGRECRIIRPLLRVRRQEIIDFLNRQGLAWREDATNHDPAHRRNFLRHTIIPQVVDRLNPQAVRALSRLAGLARQLQHVVDDFSGDLYQRARRRVSDAEIRLDLEVLAAAEPIVIAEVVRQALIDLGAGLGQMDRAAFMRVAQMAKTHRGPAAWDLPCGVRAERRDRHLRLVRPRPGAAGEPAGFQYEVAVPGCTRLEALGATLSAELLENAPGLLEAFLAHKKPHEEMFDLDRVRGRLLVRCRRPGDGLVPLGMTGHKKLQDLFVDLKVAAADRDRVPILCDAEGPLWVIPYRTADRVRVDAATKQIVRMSFVP